MKKITKLLIVFLILFIMLFPISSFALTPNEENGIMLINELDDSDNAEIATNLDAKNQADKYLIENDVSIDEKVDGNVYIIANSVNINAEIIGDAFIMADTINISKDGYINNSLYSLSNNLTISGVAYDVYACADTFKLSDGLIHRNLHLASKDVDISGKVQANVYMGCENLTFGASSENAEILINGDLKYTASKEFTIPHNVVSGMTEFTSVLIDTTPSISNYISSFVNFLFLTILVWLLYLWIAPKFTQNIQDLLKNKKSSIALYGILGLIVLPIISIILLISSLASLAGIILLVIYILLLCIAKSIFTIALSSVLCEKWKLQKFGAKLGILLVSSLVIWLISLIPYIGSILALAMIIIGLGTAFTYAIPEKK